MPGIIRSVTITPTSCLRSRSSASWPLAAARVAMPSRWKMRVTDSRLARSSSTTRTVLTGTTLALRTRLLVAKAEEGVARIRAAVGVREAGGVELTAVADLPLAVVVAGVGRPSARRVRGAALVALAHVVAGAGVEVAGAAG